jgi:NAD(P)H-dependent FMN reductase
MSDKAKDKSIDVAVFVGSLREGSFSRKVARAPVELARPPLRLTLVEIGDRQPPALQPG